MADVVYACPAFYVLHKPPGVSVQCEPLAKGVIAQLKELVGERQLHPVHRLDKVTSGLLLVARTSEANRALSLLFQERKVDKYYFALSSKVPRKKQGAVIGDMAAARNGCWKLTRGTKNPAISQFFSRGLGGGIRGFVLKPYTGKTHQLRVACKSLGAPILGDSAYGGAESDRVYLHAAMLSFVLDGKKHRFFEVPKAGEQFLNENFRGFIANHLAPEALQWPTLKQ